MVKKTTLTKELEEFRQKLRECAPFASLDEAKLITSITVHLPKEVHMAFKILCFKYNITINMALQEFIEKAILGDRHFLKTIAKINMRKKERQYKDLVSFEAENIYRSIETFEIEQKKTEEEAEKRFKTTKEEIEDDGIDWSNE